LEPIGVVKIEPRDIDRFEKLRAQQRTEACQS
jgi:hypothetical protein